MRKITKSLIALAMLLVAGSASAEDVEIEMTSDMFKEWDKTDASAIVTNDSPGIDFKVGSEISNGGVLCGTSTVNGFIYADLSSYTKIIFTGEPAAGQESFQLRVLYNREGASGTNGEKNPVITKDNPTAELDISELQLSFFHLVAVKAGWGQTGTITKITLVKPSDPLEVPKAQLKDAIDKGRSQNPFAKTADSYKALTDAIEAGETEYDNSEATEKSLADAKKKIEDAIAGLELEAGFVRVTRSMFMTWDGDGADANATGVSPAGADNIGTGVGNNAVVYGYGSGNVYWNHYADLTAFDVLYALGTAGKTARYLFNRPQDTANPSGEGTGNFIQKYVDVNDEGIAALTLSEVGTFAHLNTFKAPNGGLFTDFLVYAEKTKVSVGETGYCTFCGVMDVDLTGVTGYAAKYEDGVVKLSEVTTVPAGTGVIIKTDANSVAELKNITDATAIEGNELKVSDGSIKGDGTVFVLAKSAKHGDVGFLKVAEDVQVPAGKAYLVIEAAGGREFVPFGGEATGISTVKAAENKGMIFNLAGQRVNKAQKGLYIVNGKKIVK